jgi:hypothetical protein
MGHTIVLELSDEEYGPIEREAAATGRTPAEIIRRRLAVQPGAPPNPPLAARADEQPAASGESSGIVTYEMVQAIFAATAREMAAKSGRPAEEILAEIKARYAPKPRPILSDAEKQAELAKLMRHAGAVDSGDPRSADNDRIDADLAREYGRGLDWDE